MPDVSQLTNARSLLPPECGPCVVWDAVRDILPPECETAFSVDDLPADADSLRSPEPRRRRWISYSLRALMIAQLLVACAAYYLAAPILTHNRQETILRELSRHGQWGVSWNRRPRTWHRAWLEDALGIEPKEITSLERRDAPLTAAEAKLLARLPSLPALTFSRGVAGPEVIHELAAIRSLRRLELRDFKEVSSQDQAAGDLRRQQHLPLTADQLGRRGEMNDEVIQRLVNLRGLTWLTIDCFHVTDGGIAALAELPNLETLDIQYAKFGAAGLRPLIAANRLKNLWVPMRLSEADCAELAAFTSLKSLTCYWVAKPEGLDHLATLPNLRQLEFKGSLSHNIVLEIHRLPARVRVCFQHHLIRDSFEVANQTP